MSTEKLNTLWTKETKVPQAPRENRNPNKAEWNAELVQTVQDLDSYAESKTLSGRAKGSLEMLIVKIQGWAASNPKQDIIDDLRREAQEWIARYEISGFLPEDHLEPKPAKTGISDIIKRVAQQNVALSPTAKRCLTNVRNRLDLPGLAEATEVSAAMADALGDFIDTDGHLTIIDPTSREPIRIKLS